MKKLIFRRAFALYMVLLIALSVCSCTKHSQDNVEPTGTASAEATYTPTDFPAEKPEPEIIGTEVGVGLINITSPLTSALGSGYLIQDAIYIATDTLFVVAMGESDSILATYNVTAGTVQSRYVLPFSIPASMNYAKHGTIETFGDGVLIVDFVSGDVFTLDYSFNETARYANAAPVAPENLYADLSIDYCPEINSLIYGCYTSDTTIYKRDLASGDITVLFDEADEDDTISFTTTADGRYVNIFLFDCRIELPAEKDSCNRSYIVDSATGEVLDYTWLQSRAYSDGNSLSICKYYHYITYIDINGVSPKIDYIEEYDHANVDFGAGIAVTVANIPNDESEMLLLSAYNTTDGNRFARTEVKNPNNEWMAAVNGVFSTTTGSFDSARKDFCFLYYDTAEDYSIGTVLIWSPYDCGDQPIEASLDYLTPCVNSGVIFAPTAEVNAALCASIESQFNTKVYYGDALYAYVAEHTLYNSIVESFHDDADQCYIFECLTHMQNTLSVYPDGMLDKISASDRGPLVFLIVTRLKDTTLDFRISGQYMSAGGEQQVIINWQPYYISDFYSFGRPTAFSSMLNHEICHAVQQTLFDTTEGSVVFDFDTYMSYFPDEFSFANSYNDPSIYLYTSAENRYFVDEYSMRTVMEDMSRMFEYAMWSDIDECMYYPHINERYRYLCSLIRSAFATEAWEGVVMPWERCISADSPQE